MGSNTTHGLPYPVGTDRVMDGDDAIKALAEAVDSAVFSGVLFKAVHAGGVALGANANITTWVAQEIIGGGAYSAGGYTVPKAGLYRIYVVLKWSTAVGPATILFKNGVRIFTGGNTTPVAFGSNPLTWVDRLAANDVLTTQVNAAFTTQTDPGQNSLWLVEYIRA